MPTPFPDHWPQQCQQTWQQALATPAFQAASIRLPDLEAALVQARRRSFGRLLQALWREQLLDSSALIWQTDTQARLALPQQAALYFHGLSAAPMAAWTLNGDVYWQPPHGAAQMVLSPAALLHHLQALLGPEIHPQQFQRLVAELDNSCLNDALCLAYHHYWNTQLAANYGGHWLPALCRNHPQPTLLLEQWGTLGHPWHPNYKTRLGMAVAEVIAWAPEFDAQIELVLAAVRRDCMAVHSMPDSADFGHWFAAHFADAYAEWCAALARQHLQPQHYWPLPLHPWQAQHHLPQNWAQAIQTQQLLLAEMPRLAAKPTMSFRTVVPHTGQPQPPMCKLPVSLRLTSVERTVSPRSAAMGPRVSALLQAILAQEPGIAAALAIIPERHGLHFQAAGVSEDDARHVAALYRDHPAACIAPGHTALPLGALFATDHNGAPLWAQWLHWGSGRQDAPAALAWFAGYARQALHGLLGMYLRYGIAFEAHQQNSFVVVDAQGQLRQLLLRDFGDIRIHRATLQAHGHTLALHDPHKTLFDNAEFVREKFMHNVLMCHLGEMALLVTRHWQLPAQPCWHLLAEALQQAFAAWQPHTNPARWQAEHHAMLHAPWPAKAFVRMRIDNNSEDIVGTLPNPLAPFSGSLAPETP